LPLALVLRLRTVDPDRSDADVARGIAAAGPDSRAAEAELVRRFAARIRVYGVRHLRDRALVEDLVQVVLLQVIEALRAGRVEKLERLSSFVLGTCRNTTWDTHRAEARQRKVSHALESIVVPHSAPAEERVPLARLFECLSRLPDRESRVVRMTFFEDRTAEEVGQRLGLTPGNVRVIKHRALGALGGCVEVEERP